MHRRSPTSALFVILFAAACGGSPQPAAPAPAPGDSDVAVATPAAAAPELTDERALERGRAYAALLYQGDYEALWAALTPDARAEFGTVAHFREEGSGLMERLGAEMTLVSEDVQAARAGMRASKLYLRVSHYTGSDGRPVRLLVGLMSDGTIAGMQLRPAGQ